MPEMTRPLAILFQPICCAQVCSGCEATSAPAASSGAREARLPRARSGRHPEGVVRRLLYWCGDAVRCWRRESGRRERTSLSSSLAAHVRRCCSRRGAPELVAMGGYVLCAAAQCRGTRGGIALVCWSADRRIFFCGEFTSKTANNREFPPRVRVRESATAECDRQFLTPKPHQRPQAHGAGSGPARTAVFEPSTMHLWPRDSSCRF